VNCNIPLKTCICARVVGIGILMITYIFFESMSYDTINPKINPKNTIKTHLPIFRLMPNSQHFKKCNHNFSILIFILLNIQ
jgi:hypothetical protein